VSVSGHLSDNLSRSATALELLYLYLRFEASRPTGSATEECSYYTRA
jgi:hypothetical protein